MIVRLFGSSGLTNAYRSVLSAAGSPAMSGASRWLEAKTPVTDDAAMRSAPATPTAFDRVDKGVSPARSEADHRSIPGVCVGSAAERVATAVRAVGGDTRAPSRMDERPADRGRAAVSSGARRGSGGPRRRRSRRSRGRSRAPSRGRGERRRYRRGRPGSPRGGSGSRVDRTEAEGSVGLLPWPPCRVRGDAAPRRARRRPGPSASPRRPSRRSRGRRPGRRGRPRTARGRDRRRHPSP